MDLLAKKLASVRNVGEHPKDKQPITVRKGRFGPYVQHDKTVANLPRGVAMEDITLDEAVALLAEKGKQLKPKGGAKRGKTAKTNGAKAKAANGEDTGAVPAKVKTAAAKKAPAKKAPAKKAGTKKPAVKKVSAAAAAVRAPARRKAAD